MKESKTKGSESAMISNYADVFKTSDSYLISDQTAKILKLAVEVEKLWNDIITLADEYYANSECSERFYNPFKEIENELGKILIDSVTEMTSRSNAHVI